MVGHPLLQAGERIDRPRQREQCDREQVVTDPYRIQRLEESNERLQDEVKALRTQIQVFVNERNQLIGMGSAAKIGLKVIVALGGVGLLDIFAKLLHWLSAPMAIKTQ